MIFNDLGGPGARKCLICNDLILIEKKLDGAIKSSYIIISPLNHTMIITDKTNKVSFQGNFDSIKVGIDEKSVSHFFRMVANLYQDPVMAVLREIGANCVDALKEAKTEKLGWELHLPSRMDSNVRFVDNGVGISHDQMIRIYSIIGASSKRDDNDLIGGFGVGKWSLCSLVNNFHAISRYNGTKSTYFVCLQSNGLPDIKVIKQEQTNERNGFEVKFLCPDKSVYQFNDKLKKAYRFFNIKPSVFLDGVKKDVAYETKQPLFESKDLGFKIFDHGDESLVVMGGVGYRLPVETILENKRFEKFKVLLSHGIVLDAPIGEYSITPSREAIQLDDLTSNRIFARLDQIVTSFIPALQADMDKFDGNTWGAKGKLSIVREKFKFIPDTIRLTWKGLPLTASPLSVKTAKVKILSCSYYHKKITSEDQVKELVYNENSFVFLDDLSLGGTGRCKKFIQDEKASSTRYGSYSVYIVKKADKDAFVKETGWIGEFNMTSSLPAPVIVRASSGKGSSGLIKMRSNRTWGINDCVEPFNPSSDRIKKAERLVIFPTFANKVGECSANYVDSLINFLTLEGTITQAVFIPKKEYADFVDTEISGIPCIKIENLLAEKEIAEKISLLSSKVTKSRFFHDCGNALGWSSRNLPETIFSIASRMRNENHPVKKAVSESCEIIADAKVSTMAVMNEKFAAIVRVFASNLLVENSNLIEEKQKEFVSFAKQFLKTYPLLSYNLHSGDSDFAKAALEYIKLIDQANKN